MSDHNFSFTLIDDDETTHYLVSVLLRKEMATAKFNSFVNALDFLNVYNEQFQSDIILLDINMPRMNGWQLLDQLKGKVINIPIYMFSSSADSRDVERVKDYAMVKGYITKPLTLQLVKDLIAEVRN